MKTRIIHTKFWEDPYIEDLKPTEKLLFAFFITNDRLGLSDIYECSDRNITYRTGLTTAQVEAAKKKFEKDGKFVFYDTWIKVVNLDKYNQYKGEKNDKAKNAELKLVPDRVLKHFDRVSIGYGGFEDTSINHKSKTINQKSKIRNQKPEKGEVSEKWEIELKEVVDYYNEVFGTNIRSTKGFDKNFSEWREVHDLEKIKRAIEIARLDKFWGDKMTLQVLFRTKNPNGEAVDRIEELNNRASQRGNIAFN